MTFRDRSFCSQVFLYIQKHQLLFKNERVLLAVSGGMDSMMMLHFFERFTKKYMIHFGVGHFDHQLRPESSQEQEWLRNYCQNRHIPFWAGVEDVQSYQAQSTQSSLEAVARECRYRWLFHEARQNNYQKIVTAHTASDQAELFLMRIVRGSVRGLAGMKPISFRASDLALIRPFLGVKRRDVSDYVLKHHISYLEDPSNQEPIYFRNRIRQRIMPLLLDENPNLEGHLSALCERIHDENTYLDLEAKRCFEEMARLNNGRIEIDCQQVRQLHPALQRRLICRALEIWLKEWKTYSSRHIEAIRGLLYPGKHRQLHLPHGLIIRVGIEHKLYLESTKIN